MSQIYPIITANQNDVWETAGVPTGAPPNGEVLALDTITNVFYSTNDGGATWAKLPNSDAVLYTAQTLTMAQKNIAKANINASSIDDGDGATAVTTAGAYTNVASSTSIASGARSANVASSASTASGTRSINAASNTSTASGPQSANLASSASIASGTHSANIASNTSTVGGTQSANIASNGIAIDSAAQRLTVLSSSGGATPLTINDQNAAVVANPTGKTIILRQNGDIELDGTVSSPAADYAEWKDNLKPEPIDLALLVAYVDDGAGNFDKVVPANAGDYVVGITRSALNGGVIGNSPTKSFKRDEFGTRLQRKIDWVEKRENPEYKAERIAEIEAIFAANPSENSNKELKDELKALKAVSPTVDVPQSTTVFDIDDAVAEPTEQSLVALVGEVALRVDATVIKAGVFVDAGKNGIGTLSKERTGFFVRKITQAFDKKLGYAIVSVEVK